MTSFILLASAISLVSLWILARPLLKTQQSSSHERKEQNIHFARERLQEIERQLQNKAISEAEYEALKQEIESNLALDLDLNADKGEISASDNSSNNTPHHNESNGLLITLLCLTIPLGSIALYLITGTPEALTSTTQQAGQITDENVNEMLANVEKRLAENPDDAQGWAILARSYLALGEYDKSIKANQTLLELSGGDANVLAQMADAAALKAGGNLAGQATEYVQQALNIDPNQPQALWLAGLAAAQLGQVEKAREHWNRLLPLLEGSPEQQQELQQIIQQTKEQESQLAINPAASKQTSGEAKTGLRIRIELDISMAHLVNGNETVFVFARAKNGPPAPLAVKPLKVSDLPAEIQLSDADAMMPQFKLSLFEEVVVSARIAKSGNPIAQSGDIQSALIETNNNNQTLIQLTISQLVKL